MRGWAEDRDNETNSNDGRHERAVAACNSM